MDILLILARQALLHGTRNILMTSTGREKERVRNPNGLRRRKKGVDHAKMRPGKDGQATTEKGHDLLTQP